MEENREQNEREARGQWQRRHDDAGVQDAIVKETKYDKNYGTIPMVLHVPKTRWTKMRHWCVEEFDRKMAIKEIKRFYLTAFSQLI